MPPMSSMSTPAARSRRHACSMALPVAAAGSRRHVRSPENQTHVVGGHWHGFDQRKAHASGELLEIGDVAHAPFGVLLAQAGVEHGIAHRGVLALALERSVEKQPPLAAQITT